MDEIQIPEGATFRIQLGTFEGPLDLLLHLIKKHELDILDLPISFVTERYLDYLQMMQELDLDVASEYLLMAATLAHIKSKMLLPQNPLDEVEEQEDGYVADPRAELIRRLLEYQKYRAAAEQLGSRPIAGRDVFGRGSQTEEAQGQAPLAPIDLYKLLDAFGAILKRVKGRVALEVTAEQITIGERISQLSEVLRTKRSCTFDELFAKDRTRYEVIVTFLALLEMTKLRITRVYQSDPAAPLHIQYALLDAEAANVPSEEEVASAFASKPVDLSEAASSELEQAVALEGEADEALEAGEVAALEAAEAEALDDDEVAALEGAGGEALEEAEAAALEADGAEIFEEAEAAAFEADGAEIFEEAEAAAFPADDVDASDAPEVLANDDFVESEPLTAGESFEESFEATAVEPSAPPLESEAPLDDAVETGGLEYDALQHDVSPVDAMAGIFEQPEDVEALDPVLAHEQESEPELEATEAQPTESELTESEIERSDDEDPASDPETPV